MNDQIEPQETEPVAAENSDRPELFNRFLAKFIDMLIVLALCQLDAFFGFIAPLMGLTYILISDGLSRGSSLGKLLIGLQVVIENEENQPCSYKHSAVRNIPIGVVVLFLIIPFWGWVLFFTLGLLILGIESYQIYQDPNGLRLGDLLAETRVVDRKTSD